MYFLLTVSTLLSTTSDMVPMVTRRLSQPLFPRCPTYPAKVYPDLLHLLPTRSHAPNNLYPDLMKNQYPDLMKEFTFNGLHGYHHNNNNEMDEVNVFTIIFRAIDFGENIW